MIKMKNYITTLFFSIAAFAAQAQETVYPAPDFKGVMFIKGGTIHTGTGEVIENGTIKINNGKIEQVGVNIPIPAGDVRVFDASGKHVYPGLILPSTDLGLVEISSGVRGSNDKQELGDINPNIRSIVAYNSDSKIINVLRSNGILLAGIAPQGNLVYGSSSVVQLDAWNWEDAVYAKDNGMHIEMPGLVFNQNRPKDPDPLKQAMTNISIIKKYFSDAKAYLAESTHETVNLKLEAARPLFEKKQKLFVHATQVKQMLVAIDFAKDYGFDVVIVGGTECWQIANLLKENNLAVILKQEHSLPTTEDDDIDQPYKTPFVLQQAGVLFALNDEDETTRYRNLAFNAGTAAAYGLTREQALAAVTLNAAKILGISERTGSIEAGKDANIIVCVGDILDMRTSIVTDAFIQGRKLDLTDKHKQLFERYKYKYGIN
jgi:imidazolonepropionase-like amidohydrolase